MHSGEHPIHLLTCYPPRNRSPSKTQYLEEMGRGVRQTFWFSWNRYGSNPFSHIYSLFHPISGGSLEKLKSHPPTLVDLTPPPPTKSFAIFSRNTPPTQSEYEEHTPQNLTSSISSSSYLSLSSFFFPPVEAVQSFIPGISRLMINLLPSPTLGSIPSILSMRTRAVNNLFPA